MSSSYSAVYHPDSISIRDGIKYMRYYEIGKKISHRIEIEIYKFHKTGL